MPFALYKNIALPLDDFKSYKYSCRQSILKALAYFDMFQYPLTKEEIHQYLNQSIDCALIVPVLQKLVDEQAVYMLNEFYSLTKDASLVERRQKGNLKAALLLKRAVRIGKFLSRFPFVTGIGISGSLSKDYADENGDIDFFIITKTNRLWIARTLMHLFKKFTFLTGHQHLFCMNYYVDESASLIDDKNVFTAMEIKTLVPVVGTSSFSRFFTINSWANDFFPNCDFRRLQDSKNRNHKLKIIVEWAFNNRLGNWIDDILLRVSDNRWRRKESKGKRNVKGLTMGLVTGKHFAWSNPESFREMVLSRYERKLSELDVSDIRWPEMISLSAAK
jgi:hypothetical protein